MREREGGRERVRGGRDGDMLREMENDGEERWRERVRDGEMWTERERRKGGREKVRERG